MTSLSTSSFPSENNGGRDDPDVVIPIELSDDINITQLMSSMEERLESVEKTDWLLHPSAGRESCSIFKVPQLFVEVNSKHYHPHIVSIGPYHHGHQHLEMMQQHKWRYLGDLLARTPSTGPKLADYLEVVALEEEDIRSCYSETLNYLSKSELVEMMVLDGLFIIELFSRCEIFSGNSDDPIFSSNWLLPQLVLDFLRLENQIPFSVLQKLLDMSKPSREDINLFSSLNEAALNFFGILSFFGNVVDQRSVLEKCLNVEGQHLLDLVHSIFSSNIRGPREIPSGSVELIRTAKKLRQAGIRFKKRKATSFLDIRFRNGVLEIPHIIVDDYNIHVLLNFVAFEQCYKHCHHHISTYAVFMNCLIRRPEDATLLIDKNIIENYLGSEEELTQFFNNMCKDVDFSFDWGYLVQEFKDVNEHCNNVWNVQWAGFMLTYFETPWSFMFASAVLIALLLTGIQTVLSIFQLKGPQGRPGEQ